MNILTSTSIQNVSWHVVPGIIEVEGEINDEMATKFKKKLQRLIRGPQEEIPIFINSEGGEVYALLAMLDCAKQQMLQYPHKKLITVAWGKAFSAAVALFCIGNERYITPNSTLMIHNVQVFSSEQSSSRNFSSEAEEACRLDQVLAAMITKSSGQSQQWLETLISSKGEVYLTSKEAVDCGLATHLGTPSWTLRVGCTLEKSVEDAQCEAEVSTTSANRVVPRRPQPRRKRSRGGTFIC